MYYSIHSTTLSSFNTPSLKPHSHYPTITLIYYSYTIPFTILYYSPQSLHLFILFIQSYHHEHSPISHTLYNSLYQSFYFDISLSFFYLFSFHSIHSYTPITIPFIYSLLVTHLYSSFLLSLSNNYHNPFH